MPGATAEQVLTSAAWRREPCDADGATLQEALLLGRQNQVHGHLARAYADLADEVRVVQRQTAEYERNLRQACGLLERGGVVPVLIKSEHGADQTYTNFDLVVGEDRWGAAVGALDGWATSRSGHPLERTKLLLHPASGPAAHLHQSVSWFDVPVLDTARLRSRAEQASDRPWLVPDAPDRLRIWSAHALFQNLALDLSELLALRPLLEDQGTVDAAGVRAGEEGWSQGFELVLRTARRAVARLDAGEPVRLPVPLPSGPALMVTREHVAHLARSGRRSAAGREVALRVPLLAAKRRRLRRP